MGGPRWKTERGPVVFTSFQHETAEDRLAIITEKGFIEGDIVTWYKQELAGGSDTGFIRGATPQKGCKIRGFTIGYKVQIEVPADIIQRGRVVATTWDKKTVSPRNLVKES